MPTDTLPEPYYQDEQCTIYLGDSFDLFPILHADAAVMVTDPPYGFGYASCRPDSAWRKNYIANDDDTAARDFMLDTFGRDRPSITFGSWKRAKPTDIDNCIVWDKG